MPALGVLVIRGSHFCACLLFLCLAYVELFYSVNDLVMLINVF